MSSPVPAPESGPSPATEAELLVLVQRLEDFMVNYLEIGDKLGVEPEPESILHVVDRAIAHADEVQWTGPQVKDEIERQFLQSLYEELNLEREGLYDHWFDAKGEEHFAPLALPEWRRVLHLLRARLATVLDA